MRSEERGRQEVALTWEWSRMDAGPRLQGPKGKGTVIHGPLRAQCHRKGAWQERTQWPPEPSHCPILEPEQDSFTAVIPRPWERGCPGPLVGWQEPGPGLSSAHDSGGALRGLRPLAGPPVSSQDRIPVSIPTGSHRAGVSYLPSLWAREQGGKAEQGLRGHQTISTFTSLSRKWPAHLP